MIQKPMGNDYRSPLVFVSYSDCFDGCRPLNVYIDYTGLKHIHQVNQTRNTSMPQKSRMNLILKTYK
jgi:hypothetical protein